jgi:hypothetical protein
MGEDKKQGPAWAWIVVIITILTNPILILAILSFLKDPMFSGRTFVFFFIAAMHAILGDNLPEFSRTTFSIIAAAGNGILILWIVLFAYAIKRIRHNFNWRKDG